MSEINQIKKALYDILNDLFIWFSGKGKTIGVDDGSMLPGFGGEEGIDHEGLPCGIFREMELSCNVNVTVVTWLYASVKMAKHCIPKRMNFIMHTFLY